MATIRLLILALSFFASDLTAWQRTVLDDCNKSDPYQDQTSFEKELSPYARTLFTRLSPDKQERAMDYADESSLSPDDAVAKVTYECKKVK